MGIKSINQFLTKKVPDAFFKTTLDNFTGYRIAIDSNNYFYNIICAANKHVIYEMSNPLDEIDRELVIAKAKIIFIEFLIKITSYGITPVFIWDGISKDSKTKCKDKRREDKKKILDKISDLREKLEDTHILLRNKDEIEKFRSLISQYNVIHKNEFDYMKNLISILGFPCLNAINEGEKLCASLSREGYVYAVWSADTDNYVLGTRFLIGKDEQNEYSEDGKPLIKVVDLKSILKGLNKTHEWFIEFCIMCGCDFNDNIPNLGPQKSYNLLEKYGSIDEMLDDDSAIKMMEENVKKYEKRYNKILNMDVKTILNHEECKNEHFSVEKSNYKDKEIELNFNFSKFQDLIFSAIDEYNLHEYYDNMVSNFSKIIEAPKNIKKLFPKNKKLKF